MAKSLNSNLDEMKAGLKEMEKSGADLNKRIDESIKSLGRFSEAFSTSSNVIKVMSKDTDTLVSILENVPKLVVSVLKAYTDGQKQVAEIEKKNSTRRAKKGYRTG